jgi:superfamily II DNA/RNA helicase
VCSSDLRCVPKTLVFANSRAAVHEIEMLLGHNNLAAAVVHAGIKLAERGDVVTTFFGADGARVLLATGMIQWMEFPPVAPLVVVNFDLPRDSSTYADRATKLTPSGGRGVVIGICGQGEIEALHGIEVSCRTHIEELGRNIEDIIRQASESSDSGQP